MLLGWVVNRCILARVIIAMPLFFGIRQRRGKPAPVSRAKIHRGCLIGRSLGLGSSSAHVYSLRNVKTPISDVTPIRSAHAFRPMPFAILSSQYRGSTVSADWNRPSGGD
jgi:hypothetical protein